MIRAQLRRMEERQISIENKTDKNTITIKRLIRESAVRRQVKPPNILFRTVDDFLAFEEVDEEIYNDLVAYFVYLGRANPVDCAAEYFRSVFPEDEEVSLHLTLNGRTGPGGCKLRDSRFAQACQDAMNANKHFLNPNNVEFHEALKKALKSLKTRKWRYNRKRRQASLHENNEEFFINRRRRINNPEEDTIHGFEDTQQETKDANENEDEIEDTQDTDGVEDNMEDMQDEAEYLDENRINDDLEKNMSQDEDLEALLEEQENLFQEDLSETNSEIVLFSSPPDC